MEQYFYLTISSKYHRPHLKMINLWPSITFPSRKIHTLHYMEFTNIFTDPIEFTIISVSFILFHEHFIIKIQHYTIDFGYLSI